MKKKARKLAPAATRRRRQLVDRIESVIDAETHANGSPVKADIMGAAAAVLIGSFAPEGSTPIVVTPGGKPVSYSRKEIRAATVDVFDRCLARIVLHAFDELHVKKKPTR